MSIPSADASSVEQASGGIAAWLLAFVASTTLAQQVTWSGGLLSPEAAGGDVGVKPYHLLLAVWSVMTVGYALLHAATAVRSAPISPRDIRDDPTRVLRVVLAAYLVVLLAASTFGQLGWPKPILSPFYVITSAATGWSAWYWTQRLAANHCLRVLRGVSACFIMAVVVKAVMYRDILMSFWMAPNGHPILPTFVGGGPNLEATWMALLAALWIGRRSAIPLAVVSAGVATLYASRIGIAISIVVLATSFALQARRHAGWAVLGAGLVAACLGITVSIGLEGGDIPAVSYVVERFTSIGDEPGSVGRLVLWEGGLAVWADRPWGVGVGHAIPALEQLRGIDVPEDNLHNLPLQHLVEGGPLLALLLLSCMALISFHTVRAWRAADVNFPLWLFAALYCATAWLQFRGADVIAWTIVGCAIGTARHTDVTTTPPSEPDGNTTHARDSRGSHSCHQ